MNLFDWITSSEGSRIAAGIAGGVVASAFNWEGPWLTFRKLIIGALMAYALGPTGVLLLEWALSKIGINRLPDNAEWAAAFLIGAFSMMIIETVLRVFKAYRILRRE